MWYMLIEIIVIYEDVIKFIFVFIIVIVVVFFEFVIFMVIIV